MHILYKLSLKHFFLFFIGIAVFKKKIVQMLINNVTAVNVCPHPLPGLLLSPLGEWPGKIRLGFLYSS
jgi:hypothetical protein